MTPIYAISKTSHQGGNNTTVEKKREKAMAESETSQEATVESNGDSVVSTAHPPESSSVHGETSEENPAAGLKWILSGLAAILLIVVAVQLIRYSPPGTWAKGKQKRQQAQSTLPGAGWSSGTGISLAQQEAYLLRNAETELAGVESCLGENRKNIEDWYRENLAALETWKRKCLRDLAREEQLAWTRYNQNMKNLRSDTSAIADAESHGSQNIMRMPDGSVSTSEHVSTQGTFSSTENTYVVGNPAGQYEWEMRSIQNARNSIQQEFVKLRKKRDRYIAELERDAERRREGIHARKREITESTQIKLQGGPGVVSALSYSENGESIIMFEGRVYREGESIGAFKIRKIHPDKRVEFEKNGAILIQRVE